MNLIEALATLHNGARHIIRKDRVENDLKIMFAQNKYWKYYYNNLSNSWETSTISYMPNDNWEPVYKQKFKEGEAVLRLQNQEIYMVSSYNKEDNTYVLTHFVHHIGINGISRFEECELQNFEEARKEKGLLK